MEIYLIRHGTTKWNAEFRLQGKTNTPLDELGLEMARQTGVRFRELGITFDRIYSSPLRRAYNTARLAVGLPMLAGKVPVETGSVTERISIPRTETENGTGIQTVIGCEVDIIRDARLEELGFGRQEGKNTLEMLKDEDLPFRYFKDDPPKYDTLADSVGAESLTALCERTAEFLRDVVERPCSEMTGRTGVNPGPEEDRMPRRILISGHGACNKGLMMHIRGDRDLADFWTGGLQMNCGVDRIDYDPETGEYTVLETGRIYYPEDLAANFRNLP